MRIQLFLLLALTLPVQLPNYYVEIEHPMDLTTMYDKADSQKYHGFADLVSDFLLIPDNCFLFNEA